MGEARHHVGELCEIGVEHVLAEPEGSRIGFVKGDVRNDPLPAGYDLVSFKSMLHDWPAEQAKSFVAKAAKALEPGGTLLVFERGPLRVREAAPAFSLLPILLFFRSYRPSTEYVTMLQELGFRDIEVRDIQLDSPFFVVAGRKGVD